MRIGVLVVFGAIFALSGASAQETQFYPRPIIFQINGACTTEMSPDKAVIVGGVSIETVKPTDAVEQLEKDLSLMRRYVAEKHGELQLLERVRRIMNPQPPPTENSASLKPIPPPPLFQVVQRLQATFPVDAPVDAILEKLIELGMDRYGDNVLSPVGVSTRRESVILFQIGNFDTEMKDFQQRCTTDAWKQWCASPVPGGSCPSPTPPANLELQLFTVRSKEKLIQEVAP